MRQREPVNRRRIQCSDIYIERERERARARERERERERERKDADYLPQTHKAEKTC
jgi:hypothetical protein